MLKSRLFRSAPESVQRVTRASHYAILSDGTHALAAALWGASEHSNACDIPEVGCRSLTQAVYMANKLPRYVRVGNDLAVLEEDLCFDNVRVLMVPWFGGDLAGHLGGPHCIVDGSVNLRPIAVDAVAYVASLGCGKPGYWSHKGAIIATSNTSFMQGVERLVLSGNQGDLWREIVPRISSIDVSQAAVDEHFKWVELVSRERAYCAKTALKKLGDLGHPLEVIPASRDDLGNSLLIPVKLYLDKSEFLELLRECKEGNIPLGRQHVTDVCMEPVVAALGLDRSGTCRSFKDGHGGAYLAFVAGSAIRDSRGWERLLSVLRKFQ